MLIFLFIISFFYFGIISFFTIGILLLKKEFNQHPQKISVIIAARNEEKHLPELLDILLNQNYEKNKYEIIVADDRSIDRTSEIVEQLQKNHSNLKLVKIHKENKEIMGKKGALDAAIKEAKYDILAFTDADCLPSKNWLSEINRHFTTDTDFISGYSPLIVKNKFLFFLKNLERASIFAITAGGFGWNSGITCTARNMAYRKSLFNKVNGFSGIGYLSSGDDDLMLQKMLKYIKKMNFMFSQCSIVESYDKRNLREHADLESRRASKWKYYPLSIKLMTLFIFTYYIIFLLSFIGFIFNYISAVNFLYILLIKIISEFLLLLIFLIKIQRKSLLLAFPLAELVYIPYFIFFALKGTFGTFKWKN